MAKTTVTKSAFIRQHPNLTPIQVSAKAKEAGLDIQPNHVSSIRSTDKAKSGAPKRKPGRPRKSAATAEATAKRKPGRPPKAAAAAPAAAPLAKRKPGRPPKSAGAGSSNTGSEQALLRAAWDVAIDSGIQRVLHIVRQVEGQLRGLKR